MDAAFFYIIYRKNYFYYLYEYIERMISLNKAKSKFLYGVACNRHGGLSPFTFIFLVILYTCKRHR